MIKILLVDDEPMITEILQAYFNKEGYKVITAENGIDALKRARNEQPDLIVLTAKSAEEDRINGILIGADDYVIKPFSPREVVVRRVLFLCRSRSVNSNFN